MDMETDSPSGFPARVNMARRGRRNRRRPKRSTAGERWNMPATNLRDAFLATPQTCGFWGRDARSLRLQADGLHCAASPPLIALLNTDLGRERCSSGRMCLLASSDLRFSSP